MAPREVTQSVNFIVAAFESARSIIENIQQRICSSDTAAHKARQRSKTAREDVKAAKLLSKSLKKGQTKVYDAYTKGKGQYGVLFECGDAPAQTALAATLLRLNAGLVRIIARFIEEGCAPVAANYRGLTALANESRREATKSLRALRNRLSRTLPPARTNPQAGALVASPKPQNNLKMDASTKRKTVPPKQVQIVYIRSKKNSKGRSALTPAKQRQAVAAKPGNRTGLAKRKIEKSVPVMPQTMTLRPQARVHAPQAMPTPSSDVESWVASQNAIAAPLSTTLPARSGRQVQSMYSIETSGTRLGEIPMHEWPQPFDFDMMERINSQAAAANVAPSELNEASGAQGRPGLLRRVLRR